MVNNQEPRVLIFSTAYLPLIGGAEIAVDEITKRLSNWQFDLVTAKIQKGLKKEERINNINIYRVGFGMNIDKYLLPFLGFWKAKQLEKKNNYSLTWSIMASYGGFLGLRFKKKYPNKKWLLTLQEGDSPEYILKRVGIFKKWFYQIFQKADYFQAISEFLYKWAMDNGAELGEIVPNGVDIEKFKKVSSEGLREKLNIKENEKIILTVSRLVKKNGINDLIEAGKYLDFPFKILIVGKGSEEKDLKKLVKKLNLEEKILFLGHIQNDDLPKYYSMADVFVRPSLSEGQGISFLEAMVVGVPIIGTSVGGIPDFLKDKETGLFCKVKNSESIAENIEEILNNQEMRERIIRNGQQLIQEKYDWNIIAQKMEKIYLKLINEK